MTKVQKRQLVIEFLECARMSGVEVQNAYFTRTGLKAQAWNNLYEVNVTNKFFCIVGTGKYFKRLDGIYTDKRKQEKAQSKEKKQGFRWKAVNVYNYSDEIKEISEIEFTRCKDYSNAGRKKGKTATETKKENRKRNLQRVKRNVRRLALANDMGQMHITLTYAKDQEDYNKADDEFKQFIFKLRKEYPHLKYIATREIQESRAETYGKRVVHYHMLINQRVNKKKLDNIWSHGWTWINKHSTQYDAVSYVIKYIVKNAGSEEFVTEGGNMKKSYLSSQGLKSEVERCTAKFFIKNPEDYVLFQDERNFLMTNLEPVWDFPFEIETGDKDNPVIKGHSTLCCLKNNADGKKNVEYRNAK